jgi:hypothetical protein
MKGNSGFCKEEGVHWAAESWQQKEPHANFKTTSSLKIERKLTSENLIQKLK